MATLEWDGQNVVASVEAVKKSAVTQGARMLLDASNRIAPIETGALIRSGTVVASGTEAAVGYTSVYACRQHEEVGWAHDEGRQAKFPETAVANEGEAILQAMVDAITAAHE